MPDDAMWTALALLDQELVTPRPEFADALLTELEAELEASPSGRIRTSAATRRRTRWLGPRLLYVAAAAVVLVLAGLLLVVPKPRSAAAAIEDARSRFAALPAVHVVYTVGSDEDGRPGLERVITRDVQFATSKRWRATVVASTAASEKTGAFKVSDGSLEGVYTPDPPLFAVRRFAEIPQPVADSGIGVLSPETVWDAGGKHGVAPSTWFDRECTAKAARLLGRSASLLRCDGGRLLVWLDKQTGLLLKSVDHGAVQTLTRLDLSPTFAPDAFAVKAPDGARVRWDGALPAPAPYARPPDAKVRATIPLAGTLPRTHTAIPGGVWVVTQTREQPPYDYLLQRIDAGTGRVVVTLQTKDAIGSLLYDSGVLWSSSVTDDSGAGPSWVRPLDPMTGRPLSARITISTAPAVDPSMTADGRYLWFAGGNTTELKGSLGSTSRRSKLARIELPTRAVDQFALPGSAWSLTAGFGSVWAGLDDATVNPSRKSVVRIDASGRVVATFPVSAVGMPTSVVAGDRYMYLAPLDTEATRVVQAVDPATGKVVVRRRIPVGQLTYGAGALWVTGGPLETVRELDPLTLATVATFRVGRSPFRAVVGAESVWVLNYQDNTVSQIDTRS